MISSKRNNKTFNTSLPEERVYELLIAKYGKEGVLRQYKDDIRYPFCCDFYIKDFDVFLELNLFFSHGQHPFDSNNSNDIKQLEE